MTSTNKWFWIGAAIALVGAAVALVTWFPGAPRVQASQIVELQDGDTYDLVMDEVTKEINGEAYTMLAYNGSIPGPLVKVKQGSSVTINFTNKSSIPTMLHSHGVRMDNASDGSQTTQEEIKPGESFTYTLRFPDAGMYWYHPHVRDEYAQELGAYGGFLVSPEKSEYWNSVNAEKALFVDDILIEGGDIAADKAKAQRTLMGSFGNVMLVNGETKYELAAQKGDVVRFYITNAANTRPFNIAFKGAKMKLVGGDGGAYERDSWQDAVLISPSERAVVEVLFEESGTVTIEHRTPDRTYALGSVQVSEAPADVSRAATFNQLATHPETVASIDSIRASFAKAPDKKLKLTVDSMMSMGGSGGHGGHMMPDGSMMGGMGGMMGGVPEGGIEWEDNMAMMNQMSDVDSVKWNLVDEDSGKKNMDIDWAFKKGEPVKIRIFNDPNQMHPMQHPIHFHGQRFLVVARDGVPQTNLVWKDTVLVKAGETVDIVLDPSNPGTWMAHCHILEHIESGMMFTFKVS